MPEYIAKVSVNVSDLEVFKAVMALMVGIASNNPLDAEEPERVAQNWHEGARQVLEELSEALAPPEDTNPEIDVFDAT